MADPQFMQYLQGAVQTFNPYGAGRKVYGSGRSAPNIGPTSSPEGYAARDAAALTRRKAMLKRLKSGQRGRFMSPEYMEPRRRNG